MGWSGGSYSKGNAGTGGWAGDASAGIGIEAGRHDTQDNDFATGINQCINKDGSNSMTGPFNAGGQNIINAAKVGIGTTTPTELLTVVNNTAAGASFRSNGNSAANELFVGQGGSGYAFVSQRSTDTILDLVCGDGSYLANGAAIRLQSSGATRNGTILFSTTQGGTGVAERMRIANTGFVGIGNNNPGTILDISRSGNDQLTRGRIYNANSGSSADAGITFGNNTNQNAAAIYINSSANTADAGANGLTIINALANVFVKAGATGGVNLASGATSWAAVSDERLKKNIQPLSYGLNEILQLDPVCFDYNDDVSNDSKRMGFIAQDVLEVIPEAVSGTQESFYGLSTTELIPTLINAVKQLNAKVTALENQLSATTVLP
jgi:hypothetical protein